MKRYQRYVFWATAVFLLLGLRLEVQADIQTPDSLEDAPWEYANEVSYIGKGWIQSTCVTDKYIVCFQNGASQKSTPDTLIAFYKGDYDAQGNPVKKYTYAMHVKEMDYEHGNGMTYNPNTNEIYITAGPLLNQENSGNIYVVDADTLYYKRTIKVGDGGVNYNFIAYSQDLNQYFLQADTTGSEYIYIADENFNIVDAITDIPRIGTSYFQDFCISGDYILGISHNGSTRVDNDIEVYSISQREYLGKYNINVEGWESVVEVESISEVSPGVLMVATGVTSPRRLRFYEATVPAVFDVLTQVTNGTITESTNQAVGGQDYTVAFNTEKNYELTDLLVDSEAVEFSGDQREYTFPAVGGDHTIEAIFGKIPKFKIDTSVENGTITESKRVYRDRDFKVSYTPDKNYELGRILIDGEEVAPDGIENGYSFRNIQEKHSIQVLFEEIPSWEINTSVKNGTISESLKKAYRDSNYTVSYEPDENYMLFSVKIDGKKADREASGEKYIFTNIHGPHSVEVIYIWKYLPVVILGATVLGLIVIFQIWLQIRRKRRIRRDRERRKM